MAGDGCSDDGGHAKAHQRETNRKSLAVGKPAGGHRDRAAVDNAHAGAADQAVGQDQAANAGGVLRQDPAKADQQAARDHDCARTVLVDEPPGQARA